MAKTGLRSESVIVDAGALVALLNKNDPYHKWAAGQIAALKRPFLTCEAVLSETWYLLRGSNYVREGLLEMLTDDRLRVAFDLSAQINSVIFLIQKYNDVPMSVADACLVRMSELRKDCLVFTTDSDFNIYRRHGNQNIPVISPHQI
jgi:predicted nucleic acid-binding protein